MIRNILSRWRILWPVHLLIMLLIALCAAYLPLLLPSASVPLRIVFQWLLPALFGAWSACRLTRCGLISYAAWIAPPFVHTVVPWLAIGYPPSGLSMALCAFVSLVGAATGDVLYKRDHA